uniref:Protein kinase domain-containing protein n=1 Tax=Ascaris lumbricoides TaxID=6252 RepID=A0A0M3IFU5_ASCLU
MNKESVTGLVDPWRFSSNAIHRASAKLAVPNNTHRFRDGDGTLRHIPFRKGKNLVGTAKYASLNSHNGLELSRRDDLESLGYIIVEFINRELPWKEQRSKARFRTKQQSYNRIRNIKEQTDWSTLCPRMAEWIRYCRQLEFPDDVN